MMSSQQTRWGIGILTVLAVGASGVWFLPGAAGTRPEHLDVTVTGHRPWQPMTGLNVFESQAELQQFYPQATFRFGRDIDFSREKLVQTTWCGDGFVPPGGLGSSSVVYSQLTPRTRLVGQRVLLAMEEPRAEGRVFSQVFHEDWYALPKSTDVRIVEPQHAAILDGTHLLFVALALLLPLAAVAEGKWWRMPVQT